MGKGIDAARADGPLHAALLDDFKDQLLIVLMKRLTDKDGRVVIPVAEANDTGRDVLFISVQGFGGPRPVFHFQLGKKS